MYPHLPSPSHSQRQSSTLKPAVSSSIRLLLPITLVQDIIAPHLDSCLPISSPSSSLSGSPLVYWTHIIKNHLPPASLRSHHSPLHMPIKAPCCPPNHVNTLLILGCKAHYRLALPYLTAGHSCSTHVLRSSQAQLFHLLLSTCTAIPRQVAETAVCTHVCMCVGVGEGEVVAGEAVRDKGSQPSPDIHEHQGER